jgi:hypothetical protein
LFYLLVLNAFSEEIFLYVGESIGEEVAEVVSKELLQEEGLNLREDVYAALLAVERLELRVVLRPVPAFAHHK